MGCYCIGVGLLAWFLPDQTVEIFGLKSETQHTLNTPGQNVVTRLFGVRDFVLGGALLVATHPEAQKLALQMNLIADTTDVVATGIGYQNGLSTNGLILTGGGAAFFALLGAYGLSNLSQK